MYKNITQNVKYYQEQVLNINENAKIVVVSKTVCPEFVNIATDCGLQIIGENRVQELLCKYDDYTCKDIHFIGHLQTNKVKSIINKVTLIQSVDSFKLANIINTQAVQNSKVLDILIQINISKEDSKSGIYISEVYDFIDKIKTLSNINIRGFMAIPKNSSTYELEHDFNNMNKLFHEFNNYDILSMGMTNDFALALKHGSNMVRIGTGLFGNR